MAFAIAIEVRYLPIQLVNSRETGVVRTRTGLNRSQEPPCVIGVALVAMQIQDPFLLIQVSIKRSRRTTGLPRLVPLTAITPIAMAVFPKTRTVSDSGATCSWLPLDALMLARNSDLVLREPSSSTRMSELSRIAARALVSPAL